MDTGDIDMKKIRKNLGCETCPNNKVCYEWYPFNIRLNRGYCMRMQSCYDDTGQLVDKFCPDNHWCNW